MATPAMMPPPQMGGGPPPAGAPPQDAGTVSPAPAQANPTMNAGVSAMVKITHDLSALVKQFPTAANNYAQMQPFLAGMTSDIMQESQPPEPAAPPQG